MRYAALNGGKRFRAGLVYGAGVALRLPKESLDTLAGAVELVHAYSLVHDDLPAMDDDDLRRGQPTLHVAWNEATAILAGDALQAHAFSVLANPISGIPAEAQLAAIQTLAEAIGSLGMAGGQALDLEAEGQAAGVEALETIHKAKTGRLIEACVIAPSQMAQCAKMEREALTEFAQRLGLAYQVHDDVLDQTGDSATLGKTAGADLARDKSTYPACLGIEESRRYARELANQAVEALKPLNGPTNHLESMALWAVERHH